MADTGKPSDYGNSSQKVVSIAAGEAHTLALTEEGCVFSWGRGTFGRLGTGKEEDELLPVQIEFDSSKKVGISGEKFEEQRHKFLGHDSDNSIVPCFLEKFLELGSPDSLTDESNKDKNTPLKVRSIKAGGMMSLAIDNLGTLWMWGNCPPQSSSSNAEFSLVSSSTPLPLWDFHGHTVVKVACGNEHVVALVSAGETFTGDNLVCYSWGNNNHGQLGLGDKESRLRPEIIETFNLKSLRSVYEVACGAFHTAVLTRRKISGNVIRSSDVDSAGPEEKETICWTFGLGENGQLGQGTSNSTYSPKPVEELPPDVFLISVDCGLFHTCVVSSIGDVWSWGMEKGLGLCPDASFTGTDISGDAISPLKILCDELYESKFRGPVQVACGAAHTVLVAQDGYKLWAWGRGRSGVLGRGNTMDSYFPCVVMWPLLDEDFQEDSKNVSEEARIEDLKLKNVEEPKNMELEKRLSSAMEEVELLQSKLAVMERYAAILHGSIYGKPFEGRDLPPSLQGSGTFDIAKEWEDMLESADNGKLRRMEVFYRNMLTTVKDKLMKRRIQELITDCLRSNSSTTGAPLPM
ncbi:Regulator of chromosome condensation [Macleaya cordata]|uniref:Regulator of chromosome condensation n=1 Tax=Macleaya cordata TaxID=56857 RepID=A0A200RC44_MACCD|nr:Regulator of chromosome condensation [Macleaya cordata]